LTTHGESPSPQTTVSLERMSDSSPGPGWWLASDGNWYPPHLHPDVRARADVVVDDPERRPEREDGGVDIDLDRDRGDETVHDIDLDRGDETAVHDIDLDRDLGDDRDAPVDEITVEPDEPTAPVAPEEPVRAERVEDPTAAGPTEGHTNGSGDAHGAPYAESPPEADPGDGRRGAVVTAPAMQYVPQREPIDWDQVAKERAARRHEEDSRRRRNLLLAVGSAVVTLGVLFAIARNVNDDGDGDDARTEPTTVTSAPPATTAAPSTSDTTATTAAPTTTAPGTVSVFALQPGTCVQNPDLITGRVTTVVEVPCDQPHTHEVYHKVTYTPPDGAFDEARISQFASEQCTQSFAAYVGIPFDRSQYYYVQFSPTQESWTQQGDREVVCLLFQQGTELTGSARGTAQ
jgi:hypothetical protein